MDNKQLTKLNRIIRQDILNISHHAHMGHVGSALSVVEIITALYFKVMNIKPEDPNWPGRDRFILSKGHAAVCLYSVLHHKGFFPKEELLTFCQQGSKLLVHPEFNNLAGIEWGTGSLGHGLSVGAGMSYAAKVSNQAYHVYVLVSDGEINEGSVWEAALFASHHHLDNLTVIIDYNGSQAMGKVEEILKLEPLDKKWEAFGFKTHLVNGHNIKKLCRVLDLCREKSSKPTAIIANTVIGKGVSFMEGKFEWHYYDPKIEHLQAALKELKIK